MADSFKYEPSDCMTKTIWTTDSLDSFKNAASFGAETIVLLKDVQVLQYICLELFSLSK